MNENENFENMDYGVNAGKFKKNSDGSIIYLADKIDEMISLLSNLSIGNDLLAQAIVLLSQSMGKNAGVVINDLNLHNGEFTALVVVAEAEVTVVGDVTMTALTLPANFQLPFEFTSIQLGSGTVICLGVEAP